MANLDSTRIFGDLSVIKDTSVGGTLLVNTTDNGTDKLQVSGSTNLNGNLSIGVYDTTETGILSLNGSTANKQAVLKCTTGNLHIDCDTANATYINYYKGAAIYFGNGATGSNASVSAAGVFTGTNFSGPGTGLTGTASSLSIGGNAATATNLASIGTTFSGTYPMVVNAAGVIYSHTNVTFNGTSGALTATSFVKSGGTSLQFLKADGSVDGSTYLTGNQSITLSGDASGTGTTAITVTVSKIGSATVGSTSKPIYLSSGTPTALSATVGSTTQPVYMNAGTVTAITGSIANSTTGSAATLTTSRTIFGQSFNGSANVTGSVTATTAQFTAVGTGTPTAGLSVTSDGTLTKTKHLVFDYSPTLSSDHTYNGDTISGTAGETLAFGDFVYYKWSDSRWWKASASAYATARTRGIAVSSASAAAAVTIFIKGVIRDDT
jgi:hypothetical protein